MLDIFLQKEPALLHLLQQRSSRKDGLVDGFKAAQTLYCGKRNHGIDANSVNDFLTIVDCNEVNRSVQDPRGHIIRYDTMPGLAQLPVQMTLQRTPDRMVAPERLWQSQPCFFEVFFPCFQHLPQVVRHASSPNLAKSPVGLSANGYLTSVISTSIRPPCQRKRGVG